MKKFLKSSFLAIILVAFFPLVTSAETELSLSLFEKFTGEAASDYAGASVSSAGDVNNDGYDDILIGAYLDNTGGSSAGAAYIIYGSSALLSSIDLSEADAKFIGEEAGDLAGYSVSSAGDVNNDGYDDILIGAMGSDTGGSYAGAAYIIYGGTTGSTYGLLSGNIDLSTADAKFIGEEAGDAAGSSVSSAGDVNNDGYDDILIGADGEDTGGSSAGAAYIIYGGATGSTYGLLSGNIDLSTADAKFIGEEALDSAGISVSSAGDVNNDTYSDILIGARYNNAGGSSAGAAYIIYGSSALLSSIDLSEADAKFIGEEAGDSAGYSVSSAGDVNNDSYSDILIGARYNSTGGSYAGAAYIIYGGATGSTYGLLSGNIDLSAADAKFIGEEASNFAGISVSSAGDLNNDGYADLIIGAMGEDDGSDAAYIIYGGTTGSTYGLLSGNIDLSAADVKLNPEEIDDAVGSSVSSAGDVNGDGYDDILIGAFQEDTGDSNAGAAYFGYFYVDSDLDGIPGTDGLFDGADTNDNDHDNDGSETGTDCNDDDPTVYINQTYYADADGDGFGSTTTTSVCSSTPPIGYSPNNTDCNDDDATVHENQTYYIDADQDSYGSTATGSICSAIATAGYSTNNTDCNDEDITVNTNQTYYQDSDSDQLGNSDQTTSVCSSTPPIGYVANTLDQDDTKTDILLQYETDSDYYLDLYANGKKLSLINLDANAILDTITLSKSKKYTKNSLKLLTYRHKKLAVVVSKKKTKNLISLVYPNITKEKLTKKDQERIINSKIKPNKTKKSRNYLQLRNKKNKVLEQYFINKKYKLIIK